MGEYLLLKLEISLPPLVLALILGGTTEQSFRNSMSLSDGTPSIFFEKPISAILIVLAVLSLVYSLVKQKRHRA